LRSTQKHAQVQVGFFLVDNFWGRWCVMIALIGLAIASQTFKF
jgi:hypothetical protein